MAKRKSTDDLYDPRKSDQSVRFQLLRLDTKPVEPPRSNCFTIYLMESGAGHFCADAARFTFVAPSMLFFVPYQRIRFEPQGAVRGVAIQFHANFLCIETFHAESGCSGVLFNDPYGIPVVDLQKASFAEVSSLVELIQQEDARREKAYEEVILSYLKVLLVLATRLKSSAVVSLQSASLDERHSLLVELRDLIEEHYCELHAPSDYARLLHVTPKTLGRIVRENLGTTPTELIRSRILTHAKWQLLHTLKPVKEVAREVGFQDELYFSRLFKKATGYSPTFFREFETEIRGGSNLSMFMSDAPIQPVHPGGNNPLESSKNA